MSPMGYYITMHTDGLAWRYISDRRWTSIHWLIDSDSISAEEEISHLDDNYRIMLF